jgi:hypothetical protein
MRTSQLLFANAAAVGTCTVLTAGATSTAPCGRGDGAGAGSCTLLLDAAANALGPLLLLAPPTAVVPAAAGPKFVGVPEVPVLLAVFPLPPPAAADPTGRALPALLS